MLDILFVTDYVCPYCLVAKEALRQALEETGIYADIRIQPMELTPEPKERVDTYNDPVRRSHYTVLVEPCKELGLDMKLPPAVVPRPYSRYAFEGRFAAIANRKEAEYNDLMYKAYFIEEKDIGDINVLSELVERIGLDPVAYRKALEDGTYEQAQKNCNTYSRQTLKPSGLPTIYINDEKITLSSYTKKEMVKILKTFEQPSSTFSFAPAVEDEEEDNFFGCGPDGC